MRISEFKQSQKITATRFCNICKSKAFQDANGRHLALCSGCKALERTRLLWLYLDRHIQMNRLNSQSKVLHIAPEAGIYNRLKSILPPENYKVCDYSPQNYPHIPTCSKIDLMNLDHEQSDHYDFIIHSHVLEHISCNIAYTLFHLHRMLRHSGHHIFIIPLQEGYYEESFAPLSNAERTQRFGQFDHVRSIGTTDIHNHLGRLLHLPAEFDAEKDFGAELLTLYNIPEYHWKGLNFGTVFDLGKNDYLLTENRSETGLLNILMRTSNRPHGFKRMMNSIRSQSFKNYRILVSVDDDASEEYVKQYHDVQYVRVNRVERIDETHFPYNLYFNTLINEVSEGWILFVDDDDRLKDSDTLQEIVNSISDSEHIHIFRMQYINRLVPGESFGKDIVCCDISTSNLLVHSSKAKLSQWPDKRMGDFFYIKGLVDAMGMQSIKWIDKVTYIIDKIGTGSRIDIDQN